MFKAAIVAVALLAGSDGGSKPDPWKEKSFSLAMVEADGVYLIYDRKAGDTPILIKEVDRGFVVKVNRTDNVRVEMPNGKVCW